MDAKSLSTAISELINAAWQAVHAETRETHWQSRDRVTKSREHVFALTDSFADFGLEWVIATRHECNELVSCLEISFMAFDFEPCDKFQFIKANRQRKQAIESISKAIQPLQNRLYQLSLLPSVSHNGGSKPNGQGSKIKLVDGGYSVLGKVINLTGRPLAMLTALLSAREYRLSVNSLIEKMEIDTPEFPTEVVKDAAKDLRSSFRGALRLTGKSETPLRSTGKGKDLAYWLEIDQIP